MSLIFFHFYLKISEEKTHLSRAKYFGAFNAPVSLLDNSR